MAQHLVLDVGNSRTKQGLFAGEQLMRTGVANNGDLQAVKTFIDNEHVERVAIGSVAKEDGAFMEALATIAPVTLITGTSPSPLTNAYQTQATLGVDRLANAVGAVRFFPGRPVLAIDMGTCVTYDLVDGTGAYLGGLISPGLRMRARAMNAYSARLPLVEPDEHVQVIGRSTQESLSSGSHHGLRAELKTLIAELGQQHPGLAVVLTGGDAPRFARALENGIFAHPFLTLLGLHALLLFDRPPAGVAAAG